MAKNSFILYHNYREQLEDLTDEQVGKLFRAIFDYEIDDTLPEFTDKELKIAFKFIKVHLDNDREKYAEMCEKQKRNIQKRWNKNNTNDTNVYGGIPKIPEYTKHTDNDNVNDNDSDNDNVNVNDINIKEKIYKKEKYSIADIKKVCGQVSPVLLVRHNEDNNADYRLGVIHKELMQYMSLEEIEKLLLHANQTYIVQPKYSNLDLVWVLNNSKKVLQAEPITDIQREEKEEPEYTVDGDYLIFKNGQRVHKGTYEGWKAASKGN